MTKRNVFQKTIEFNKPEYIPHLFDINFNSLREKNPEKESYILDLLNRLGWNNFNYFWCWLDKNETVDGTVYKTDEWGTKWQDNGLGMITVYHPMQDGYEYINRVNFPDPDDQRRFEFADSVLPDRPDKYIVGALWFTLFERLWMLRGMENLLIDPYLNPDEFFDLKERVMQVNMGIIDQWLQRDIDAVYFSDDWGSQQSLLIDPDDWRRFYKDDYERMFKRVRRAGKHVWMHLCGNVTSIIPDLIDIGLNVLNPVQPQAMDVNELGRRFGGKVCFNGGMDVQGTMIHGSPDDIRKEFHNLVKVFGSYNGGYIANTSHAIMPETPLDNIIVLLETVQDYNDRHMKEG